MIEKTTKIAETCSSLAEHGGAIGVAITLCLLAVASTLVGFFIPNRRTGDIYSDSGINWLAVMVIFGLLVFCFFGR